jgi:hypothetical protein
MEIPFDKIKAFPLVISLCVIGSLLLGYIVVLVCDRDLFMQLDAFKLSVVSIGISMPLFAVNIALSYMVILVMNNRLVKPLSELMFHNYCVYYASLTTCACILFTIFLTLRYGFDTKLKIIKTFLLCELCIFVALVILTYLATWKHKKSN